MFERFTEKAIKSITIAQEESRRLGHNYVGSEQILLGLIDEETGIASRTLRSMGVGIARTRIEVEQRIGRGSGLVPANTSIPFTERAKRILELSFQETHDRELDYVDTEHLLLGLIREGEGVGIKVLSNILGVDIHNIHDQVNRKIETLYKVKQDKTLKNTRKQDLEFFSKCHHNALRVMMLAEEESRRLGHNFVGTEQILVGLVEEDTGLAAQVLKSMDVNLEKIRQTVEQVIGHGRGTQSSEIPLTPAAVRLLHLSLEEAQQLNHEQINTEHLLLGIIRMAEERMP